MGLLGDILSPISGLTGGGKGGGLLGGGSSITSLLASLIGGGAGNAGSTILPAALNMLFSGKSMSQGIPQPIGTGGPMGSMGPVDQGQNQQNGQPQGGQLPKLNPSQFGSDFTPQAPPMMKHALSWYSGDPSAPMPSAAQLMQQAKIRQPQMQPPPYDFNNYYGGQ